jgi:hypothetical protein
MRNMVWIIDENSVELPNPEDDLEEAYIDDITDALHKEDQGVKLTDVRRISPVQFLRDRELGIRGTGQRIVRQGVVIDTEFPYDWDSDVRRKVYRRLRDECVDEEKERAARCTNVAPYYIEPIVDNRYWATKIFEKINYECETLYIKIRTGIGQYVELVVVNNSARLYMYANSFNDPKHSSMLQRSSERYHDDFDNWHFDTPYFCSHRFMQEHYCVQYCKRYCSACDRVACKCSIEECDVI